MTDVRMKSEETRKFYGTTTSIITGEDGNRYLIVSDFAKEHFHSRSDEFHGARLTDSKYDALKVKIFHAGKYKGRLGLITTGFTVWHADMTGKIRLYEKYKVQIDQIAELPMALQAWDSGAAEWPIPIKTPMKPPIVDSASNLQDSRASAVNPLNTGINDETSDEEYYGEPVDEEPTPVGAIVHTLCAGRPLDCVTIDGDGYVTIRSLVTPFGKHTGNQVARLQRDEPEVALRKVQPPHGPPVWCAYYQHVGGVLWGLRKQGMTQAQQQVHGCFKTEALQVLHGHFDEGVSINPRFSIEELTAAFNAKLKVVLEKADADHAELTQKIDGLITLITHNTKPPIKVAGYFYIREGAMRSLMHESTTATKDKWQGPANKLTETLRELDMIPPVHMRICDGTPDQIERWGTWGIDVPYSNVQQGSRTVYEAELKALKINYQALLDVRPALISKKLVDADAPMPLTESPYHNVIPHNFRNR